MRKFQNVVAIDVKQGFDVLKQGGRDAFVGHFMKAAKTEREIEFTMADFDRLAVIDVAQGLDVLNQAGRDSFIVYFLLEG